MALFESYERRIDKITAVLNSYGIASLEEAEKITKDAGLDVYNQIKGTSRPLLHLNTPKTLGLNESATVYMLTIPFHIPHATTLTVGMNNNSGGITQGIYGREVSFKAGQICGVRQGSRQAPPFKDGINFYCGKKLDDGTYEYQDGWWRCDLPIESQFSGEFSFEDLFYSFNTGDAKFNLHAIGNQNDKAGNNGTAAGVAEFNELASCCQGYRWIRNKRFNHNFDVSYGDKSGLFYHCYAGYLVGTWEIWFRLEDPLEELIKNVDGDILLETTPTINGADLWQNKYWAPLVEYKNLQKGAQASICEFYASAPSALSIGENSTQDEYDAFYNNWKSWYVSNSAGEKLIWNDGHSIQMSEYVAKFCQQSKGVYWQPAWFRRFDSEKKEYVPGGEAAWDGGAEAAKSGISISSDGKLVTSSDYDGSAFDFAQRRNCIVRRNCPFSCTGGKIYFKCGTVKSGRMRRSTVSRGAYQKRIMNCHRVEECISIRRCIVRS